MPTNAEIAGYVKQNLNDPSAIARGMQQYGVNLGQIAKATGYSDQQIKDYTAGSGNEYLKGAASNYGRGALSAIGKTDPTTATVADLTANAGEMRGPTTYKPDDSALVSKQLSALLSGDSPYIQRARTKAAEYSNSRGLLNSSIGAGAGEAAAIDAALPIAQGDATAFFTAQRDNASAQNTFDTASNSFGRQGALSIFGAQMDAGQQQRTQDFTSGEREASQDFTVARDNTAFNNDLQRIVAQTDASIKLYDKQNGTSLYNAYRTASAGVSDDYATAYNAIQASDMDPDVKAAQIASLQGVAVSRQRFISTMYAESPGWTAEWAQFAMDFGG